MKERLIYSCDKTNDIHDYKGRLEKATIADKDELSQMSYQYHLDEYGKYALRSLDYMGNIVTKGIENGNMYKLTVDGQITSMAQVISENNIAPLIGQLYTKQELRKNGYATSILLQLTNELLLKGHKKCGLLSDKSNEFSNAVFRKVGYKDFYCQLAGWLE
jgi:predicted GNAT family acetyltransferase